MNDLDPDDFSYQSSKITRHNMFDYNERTSIWKFLETNLNNFKGVVLDLGCGSKPYRNLILTSPNVKEYIGLDIKTFDNDNLNLFLLKDKLPDIFWNGEVIPLEDNSVHTILSTQVLEHVFEPQNYLREAYRVLRKNGKLIMTVRNFWPTHGSPYDAYRYTPYGLKYLLEKAGFLNVCIESRGGYHTKMANDIAIWALFSPMSSTKRRIIKFLVFPIVKYLLQKNGELDTFSEMYYPSGLSAICEK